MPNVSHSPDETDRAWRGLTDAIESLNKKMKGLVVPKRPIDPGAFVDEFSNCSGETCKLSLQTDRPVLVEHIIISGDQYNGDGYVDIGPESGNYRHIPIIWKVTEFPIDMRCEMILKPGDSLRLYIPTSTATYIEIMGKVLSGTEWSQV